jgi:hypothetical protein
MIKPEAQIPAMIFHSAALGMYSTHSCKVDGTKPGMIKPMPFFDPDPHKSERAGDVRVLHLRHRNDGMVWWYTLMPTPHGTFRIVRIQHDFLS